MQFYPTGAIIAAPTTSLPEEIDPNNFGYLGNFPQAFSHIGYIMSAYYIDKYKKRKLSQADSSAK